MDTYSRKETVTPSRATELLKTNNNFRKINNSRVAQYAADMTAGKWVYNGESIVLGSDGGLRNGQHRLSACIRANVPFTTQIVYGVDSEIFDQGFVRPCGQYTRDTLLAGILTLVVRYENKRLSEVGSRGGLVPPTLQEKLAALDRYPELKDLSKKYRKFKTQKVTLGFMWWLFGQSYPRKADEFFNLFVSGQNLNASQPVFYLRKKLIEDKPSNGAQFRQEAVLAWSFYALNAHVKNVQVKQGRGWLKKGALEVL